ncbi:MAG: flagellar type III secretion system protein FliQ [Phycisphaerales bacterium]|nr:flagellar type III secretion system protein FliQ [Phycisphaerales bacterium]
MVREALSQALLLAAPILLAGLVIGLIVSIFQTVTQVQEQTLSFVPKIAGMILVGIAIIPWIINVMIDYATAMFTGN